MNLENNIGQKIKLRLEDFSDTPEASVWQNIEVELKRKKRRRLFFWWFLGSALIIALILAFTFNSKSNVETKNLNPITTNSPTFNDSKETNADQKPEQNSAIILSQAEEEEEEEELVNQRDSINSAQINNNKLSTSSKNDNDNQESSVANQHKTGKNSTVSYGNKSPKPNTQPQLLDSNRNNKTETAINNKEQNKTALKNNATDKDNDVIEGKDEDEDEDEDEIIEIKPEDDITEPITEDKAKDSIADNRSKWSITPQVILSRHGSFDGSTTSNTTYNYGVLASYRMNPKIYARTGIRVLNLSQNVNGPTIVTEYFQFPLEVKYTPFNSKINPYFIGGFSFYTLRASNAATENLRATTGLNAGLGTEVKLFNKIYLNTEANFNYQIVPFLGANDNKSYLLNFSLGLEYRF